MKTSYFGRMNSKNFKGQSNNGVSIARSNRYWSGRTYPQLYPTWEMIKMENEAKYRKAYREQVLDKLDAHEVYCELGEDAILLCHEKNEDIENGTTFCHRLMVARWLEEELAEIGIKIKVEELRDVKEELKSELKNSKARKAGAQISLFDDDSDWYDDEDWDV